MRVMVTVPQAGRPRHLLVEAPPGASVGDLHAIVGLPGPDPGVAPDAPLRHGYAVDAPAGPGAGTCPVRLVVAAGPDAGGSVPLPPGRWVTVGRAASCDLTVLDPTLSREHVRVRQERTGVVVEDLGSTNGLRWEPPPAAGADRSAVASGRAGATGPLTPVPWPTGSTLEVGATRLALVLEPLPPAAARDHDGRRLVSPWPRQVPEVDPVRLSSPAPPRRRVVRAPSAWVWALPMVASVLIAAVLRMPMVLLFGLMAPAMVLGHHLGERRSARLDHEAATQHHADVREELGTTASRAVAEELCVRRARQPGVLGVVTSLTPWPTTGLWSRAGEAPHVVVGEGCLPSAVELDGVPLPHGAAPVCLDLSEPVAVVGPPGLRAGVVRAWLLQLACGHPPTDLTLVVDPAAPPEADWDLLAWLPHTGPGTGSRTPIRIPWDRPDGILLLDDPRDAPAGTTQVLLADPSCAVLRRPGRADVRLLPTMVGLPLARHLARRLAAFDHERVGAAAGRAEAVTLGDLLPWPDDEDAARVLWSVSGPDLRAPIGTDDDGQPLVVDLARDGPHALVAGTTGSGKSELLRTLVTALALRNPPSSLGLLLIDYKGGASLGECAALPHTTGLVTDLDPHLAERVLVSLRAELRRRESVLAGSGARDVRDHDGADLPRLLVVVDEFRVLAEELPDFLGGLVRLASVGRSLGVHLVLATQRPAGVVSADLRANVNLRIALRVRDAADSLDVLEAPDAAALPEGQPGRGLLRTGSAPPRWLQVAPAAPGAATSSEPRWHIEDVDGAWSGWSRLRAQAVGRGVESGLGDLPELLTRVAREDGHRALQVWQPPLDDCIPSDTSGSWALADRPDLQRYEPVAWDATRHVGVVGAGRSGRTTAARSLVRAAGAAWLYVVDPARGLEETELARHPGVRAWVGPHDPAHAVRVLEVVNEVIDDRLAAGPGVPEGPVVLVIDGWDRFVESYGDAGQGRARELALRVLRDGAGAGVVGLLTGDRSLLLGGVASALPETWALRLHDAADRAMAGLRGHQVPTHQPPGRAVRTADGLVAQVLRPGTGRSTPGAPPGPPPPRVVSLPVTVGRADTWAVGGDDAGPVALPRAPFLVLGPPGSGVSTTLAALAASWDGEVVTVDAAQVDDGDTLAARLTGQVATVVVDDAHLLAGTPAEQLVLAWAERSGGRLLVGTELDAGSSLFRGLVPHVARHRRGLVLRPTTPSHGTPLGVRLPVGDRGVPGRGVLVEQGRCTRVQVVPVSARQGPS